MRSNPRLIIPHRRQTQTTQIQLLVNKRHKFFIMTNRISLFISLFIASTLWVNHAQAQQQKDSITQQTIDIYNIYQPELPAAAKIDLNAGLPNGEKTKPNLIYSIPSQNLNFSYSPIPLQPLAMGIDTSYYSLYNNY